jgi:hypothetical protein
MLLHSEWMGMCQRFFMKSSRINPPDEQAVLIMIISFHHRGYMVQ